MFLPASAGRNRVFLCGGWIACPSTAPPAIWLAFSNYLDKGAADQYWGSLSESSVSGRGPAEGGGISGIAEFERTLWNLVLRFSHRSITARTARSTGHAMPATCWALLEHLDAAGPMRVSDIAAGHGVDVSSITPRLKVLEAEGLVERRRDPRDRRVSVIAIGEEGREALESLHRARLELFSRALTPEDLERLPHLTEMLGRITKSLQESLDEAPADHRKEAER